MAGWNIQRSRRVPLGRNRAAHKEVRSQLGIESPARASPGGPPAVSIDLPTFNNKRAGNGSGKRRGRFCPINFRARSAINDCDHSQLATLTAHGLMRKLKTTRAWSIKESLRDLWKCRSRTGVEKHWRWWYGWAIRSRLAPVKKVASMLKDHLPGVLAYFRHRVTNAASEGVNAKNPEDQEDKKMAYGFRNRQHFKTAIFFHCGGLDLYPATH
jgi:hypothetical protein